MRKTYLFALALAVFFLIAGKSNAQNYGTNPPVQDFSPAFSITKSGISLLLSQKGTIITYVINGQGTLSYDAQQRIEQVNNLEVSYDLQGRLSKVGNAEISYDSHSRMNKIGDDAIDYDLSGRVRKIGTTEISYHFVTGNIDRIKG